MRFMFCSPVVLYGNGLYYDQDNTYSGDHGAKPLQIPTEGAIGKQFSVLNPNPAEQQDGAKSWKRYVYETVSSEVLPDGRTLIRTKFIRLAEKS